MIYNKGTDTRDTSSALGKHLYIFFFLRREQRAAEVEKSTVGLRMLNSWNLASLNLEMSTVLFFKHFIVYYESIKREPKIRGIYECRCDERLQTKTKEFTRLPYTGLVLELEHLKIETRLISERFPNVMGECAN